MNTRSDTTKLCGTPDVPHAHVAPTMGIRVFSVACLLFALLFYYCSVLRLPLKQTNLLDLGPYPDAVEYFAQATSLLRHGAPTIQIGYDKLPSRYPAGYPVLMSSWLRCLPHNGILAPFRTNQTIGLVLLVGCFALYFRLGKPLLGGVATVLLATQPAFVTYSRASMSDLSGAAAAVLAFALVYIGLTARRRWPIYLAAAVLGLSLSIRPQLLFLAPLLISMALFPVSRSRLHWFLHCVLVIVAFMLAAGPYFIMNTVEFGHPLKTGYDFWVPALTDKQVPFSLHNIPLQAAMLWSEATASWDQFRVANLFGTGTYFVPAFVLLALVGGAFCRWSRFTASALLAGTAFFVATASYNFIDGRFYMPVQFLLVALAALPVEWALRGGPGWRQPYPRVAILVLFGLSCIGYPSQSGFPPQIGRSQTWDALHYHSAQENSPRYNTVKNFIKTWQWRPGIVLSNIDPVYLNALLPETFVAAPIDGNHSYCYSRLWHYGRAEAARLASTGLARHLPVYALLFDPKSPEELSRRLPSIDGYWWKSEAGSDKTTEVLILTPNPVSTMSHPVLIRPGT